MRTPWTLLFVPLLLMAVWGVLLSPSLQLTTLEERAGDGLICARYQLRGELPRDPRIVLIGMDEELNRVIGKPQVFWEPDLAELAQGILDAGARGVVLDVVLNLDASRLPAEFQQRFDEGRIPLLTALLTGKLLLLDMPGTGGKGGSHPHPALVETGRVNNAIVSGLLDTSSDGLSRLVPLEAPPDLALSLRLAQLAGEDRRPPTEQSGLTPLLRINPPGPFWKWESGGKLLERIRRGEKPVELKDKLCLIGPQADQYQDQRPGSFDLLASKLEAGGTLGLELHAAALDTILSRRFLLPFSPLLAGLLTLAASCAAAALAFTLPLRTSMVGEAGLLVGYAAVSVVAFAYANTWLPVVGPLSAALVSFGWGYMVRYLKVEKERARTRDFFARMVAPQVVDRVLADPSLQKLGGTQRTVTVLYTDINHFTPTCERHTPAEVIVMLNDYFKEMVDIIFRSEGMLKQFVGDEIMVIYGAPADQPDHAARAVRTALEMQERLRQLGELNHGKDGFYDVKLGIHTGDVVVGHVGAEQHMEYAAVGDDVNLGARIMATTKKVGCNLLISDVTRRAAAPLLPEVEWISHGVQSFKGKTAQIEVFEARRKTGDS